MNWVEIFELICKIDWDTIFNIFANIAVIISLPFIFLQLFEMQRTTQAESYSVAREILQDEKVRQARKTVFRLGEKNKAVKKWSKSEIESAEMVCHTYDAVGQMVRNGLLKKEIIIDNWGTSLRRSWPILAPFIQKHRLEWTADETWDDYEWLVKESIRVNELKSPTQ